ncbi:glycosyl transferase [Candidatus Saccharibacteria bacterium]|nr:glycosyl transferase [Candidatus Saccharibacteria bacterium]
MSTKKIPRIIHYCWFGGKPLSKETKELMKTWEEQCPDYKIMRWDESNFNINKYNYAKEAYEKKKWAFIADVCRLEKMYKFGGIYMDVNTKVFKNLDKFLNEDMFMGFEQDNHIAGCIFGAKKHHPFIKKIIKNFYKREHLIDENGEINLRTINSRMQEELIKMGMNPEDSFQKLKDITVYPKEYFCPRYWNSPKQDRITDNTYTMHYFGASWHDKDTRERLEQQRGGIVL